MTGHRGAHVGLRAGFLAALPWDDPERCMARAHARWCTGCRDALAEGERLMSLLSLVLAEPAAAAATAASARGAAERAALEAAAAALEDLEPLPYRMARGCPIGPPPISGRPASRRG